MVKFVIKTGFYCNFDCVHCVISPSCSLGNLSFEKIHILIERIPKENSITITGGEPTIRPDFLRILDLCKDHKEISIQTNGTGLTENVCKKLAGLNANVLLTVHSIDENVYVKTTRCKKDSYNKMIFGIENLIKYRVPTIFQIIVHKLTKDTILETFKYIKSINKRARFKLTYPEPDGNANNRELLCSFTELKPLIDELISKFADNIVFEGFPLCIIQDHQVSLYDEEIYGFDLSNNCQIRYNNSGKGGFVTSCEGCTYKRDCCKIYKKYVDYFGSDEFKSIKKDVVTNDCQNYMFDSFFLWVFVTRKCNRNCEYCKQGEPMLLNESMTERDLRYILDECIKIHNKGLVRQFSFALSGGEPFLEFDMFSKVVPEYHEKYSHIFKFCSSTNGTIMNDEVINFIKTYYHGTACISLDSLKFSKPLNGISSSKTQLEYIKKLQAINIKPGCLTVYSTQTDQEMLDLAAYVSENCSHWRILNCKPNPHKKEKILQMAKPVIKFLYDNDFYTARYFDFDSWDLWNRKIVAGCPCGRRLLGILPNLQVIPNNGEEILDFGKFSAEDFIDIINHPKNTYYREDHRPDLCKDCELREECDGGCRMDHKNSETLKERCDSIKDLMEYVKTLN